MQVVFLVEGSDLDSLSSAVAYCILNENSYISIPDNYSKTVKLALSIFKEEIKIIKKIPSNIKKAIFVDTSSIEKIKAIIKKHNLDFENTKIEIFDHHIAGEIKNKNLPSNIKYHLFSYGACTTHFVFEIEKKNITLTKQQATLITLGIYEDTGSFRYAGTTPEDIKALYILSKFGLDYDTINQILSKKFDEKTLHILENLIDNLRIVFVNSQKIGLSLTYINDYVPDISSYFNNIKEFSELDAIFAVLATKNKNFIIGRSNNDEINIGYILSFLGGGGHKRAGSATVKGLTGNETIEYLHTIIDNILGKNQKVENIMHKNICVVSKDTKIIDLKNIKTPICIVVDKNGKFLGIIFEKNIKYAIKHNLENLTAFDFAISDIYTLSPKQKISEIEKQILAVSQEIFPVLDRQKPVGIVSKIDIIKALHSSEFDSEKEVFISRRRIIPKHYDFRKKLEKFFDKKIINILSNLGELAKKLNMRAYLVGGIVRDIILNRENLDIDIIVEGNAIKLAKEFAKQNNYSFHKFDEFLTANVKTKDGLKIDFATARKEIYEYPGAYPKVKKASLKEDLFRRDFTINTLAIDITADNFGIMLDYFNGYKDLKEKVIRILHQLSFIEDPIRILRAVRFAGRFNFKIGKTTEKLLKIAVDQKLLNVAPTGRINLELNLTFNEARVIEIIHLMDKYKILHNLFPNFFLSEEKKEFLEKVKNHITMFKEFFLQKIDNPKVYLTVILYHLPLEVSYQVLKKYHFENIFKTLEEFLSVIDKIKLQQKPSEIYEIIKNLSKETKVLIVSYFNEELSKKIIDILKKIEEKKLIISGKDLKSLGLKPSSKFAEIIDTVFKAYLDGEIKDKKEAKEFVKQNYI